METQFRKKERKTKQSIVELGSVHHFFCDLMINILAIYCASMQVSFATNKMEHDI